MTSIFLNSGEMLDMSTFWAIFQKNSSFESKLCPMIQSKCLLAEALLFDFDWHFEDAAPSGDTLFIGRQPL